MNAKLLLVLLLQASMVSAASSPAAPAPRPDPGPASSAAPLLTGFGDSITYGVRDTSGQGGWLGMLGKKLGYAVNNQGVGTQTSTQIKGRLVAAGQPVTVSGGQIPSGPNCAVALTWSSPGDAPAFATHTMSPSIKQLPPPFSNSNGRNIGGMWGTIAGVEGQVVDGSWSDAEHKWVFQHTYTFSPRVCPRSPVPVPPGTTWKPMLFDWKNSLFFLEGGYNNIQVAGGVERVKSDFDQMVAEIPGSGTGKRLVIFPVMYAATWKADGWQAKNVAAVNTYLQSTYGQYWAIVNGQNLLEYLGSQYDHNNPVDVYEHTFNPLAVPSSMRAMWTNIGTLTNPITDASSCSFSLSAKQLYEFITVDSESIKIVTMNGNDVTECMRGFGGTKASPHSAGASYSGQDIVHPNTKGHEAIAAFFYSWVTQNSASLLGKSGTTHRQ